MKKILLSCLLSIFLLVAFTVPAAAQDINQLYFACEDSGGFFDYLIRDHLAMCEVNGDQAKAQAFVKACEVEFGQYNGSWYEEDGNFYCEF
ncbi:MAG: hypothetical protein F6J96_13160 [Symploca sp. SIO1C2]|nr:hypothetical protein [Symploca sp. SIO1C2]